MRECVCAPVTMPGGAHHSAGLSPEHMGSCPEGLTCPLPCPPPPGRGASALQAASAPPTRQGTSWSGPGALSPDAQFQPEGGGLCFLFGFVSEFRWQLLMFVIPSKITAVASSVELIAALQRLERQFSTCS